MKLSPQAKKFTERCESLTAAGKPSDQAVLEAATEDPAAHKAYVAEHQKLAGDGPHQNN